MRRLVSEARVARFASVRPDGRPHVVPIVFAIEGEVLYSSVDEKPKSSKELVRIENIRANPKVSVLIDEYDEDWTKLWWVRLDGDAEVVDSGPGRERGLALLAEKYERYRTDMPPQGEVISVRIESWRGWAWSSLESPA